MFCTKCGNLFPDDADYCPYCGTKAVIKRPANTNTSFADNNEQVIVAEPSSLPATESKGATKGNGNKTPLKSIVIITAVIGILIAVACWYTVPPEGAMEATFRISEINPSQSVTDANFIAVPMVHDYGINAEKFAEWGFGIQSEQDYLRGGNSSIMIKCDKDNRFEMDFSGTYVYGDYYYNKDSEEIIFYPDGDDNTYEASYVIGELTMISNDGSVFIFK